MVYANDMILTSDDEPGIVELKKNLAREFQIKDPETFRYFRDRIRKIKEVSLLIIIIIINKK